MPPRFASPSLIPDGLCSPLQVNYVEADTIVKTNALLSQANAPAGLGRISHAASGNTSYVFDSSAGAGITAYIVDTGILVTHEVSSHYWNQLACAYSHRNSKAVLRSEPTLPTTWYACIQTSNLDCMLIE